MVYSVRMERFQEYVFSAALGWNVVNIYVKSIWSSVSFKAIVSLLIFWVDDLSIAVSEMLKSPTIMVLPSMSFFIFMINWFIYLGASHLVHKCLQLLGLLDG